jgi:hypothetical protein
MTRCRRSPTCCAASVLSSASSFSATPSPLSDQHAAAALSGPAPRTGVATNDKLCWRILTLKPKGAPAARTGGEGSSDKPLASDRCFSSFAKSVEHLYVALTRAYIDVASPYVREHVIRVRASIHRVEKPAASHFRYANCCGAPKHGAYAAVGRIECYWESGAKRVC